MQGEGEEELDLEEEEDGSEEEAEDEGAEEGEEEAEEEEEDRGDVLHPEETDENLRAVADGGKKAGGNRIPPGRFNEVNEKRIRAEERAALLAAENERLRGGGKGKGGGNDEPAFDFEKKEEEYADAIMEGDKAKAQAIRKEIRAAERKEIEETATTNAYTRIKTEQVKADLAAAAEAVIEDYPFLDSLSGKGNPKAIKDVAEWRDFYIGKGETPAAALMKAAKKIAPLYAPKQKAKEKDAEDDDADQAKGGGSKIDELRRARIRRNAGAANAQPPKLDGGMGNRAASGKVNVAEMSDADFAKLPEKEKAKLRGDIA